MPRTNVWLSKLVSVCEPVSRLPPPSRVRLRSARLKLLTGSVNVIGDVMGYFTIGTTNETYHPIYPLRTYTSSPIAAGATVTVPIGDPVIAPSPTVVGVLEGSPQGTGRFVAYPSTISLPLITSVTFNGTTNTNNLNFLTTGNGAIDIANASTSANVANIDTQGYFSIG